MELSHGFQSLSLQSFQSKSPEKNNPRTDDCATAGSDAQELVRAHAEMGNMAFSRILKRRRSFAIIVNELAMLQVCRAMRHDALPMIYGNAFLAVDLRSIFNAGMAWVNALSEEAIAALQKLGITTIMECECGNKHVALGSGPVFDGGSGYPIKADPKKGWLSITVTVERSCTEEPYGVSADEYEMCGERPMVITGALVRRLDAMSLEDEEAEMDRQGLVDILSLMQSVSPWVAEEDEHRSESGEREDENDG
ncbi:hypothetical protein B0A55_06233 [Friedmanniomyces simplex]|uniref:Uncharacterized protein n=1 Tax=Friedmanniomyces simplex TaxID=329884 RepID=A0A4U0X415_9PEZI|nr:hypothetical protein B0A55_06233 [Friedmanniomyces simplex]